MIGIALPHFRIICTKSFCRQSSNEVRVRFAPSPTGNLHLGGLRTALYNFLFARSRGGKFVLRIEDTDQERLVPGAVQQIEKTLDRYKLFRDEGPSCGGKFGPYTQSERKYFYQNAVQQLIDNGHAYRCFCSKTRLDMLRREAARRNEVPRYDNHCRALTKEEVEKKLERGESYVVRFKLEQKEMSFNDEIFGKITQKTDEGDFIVMKTNLYPTYHLANVVDDHYMQISHVIRGCEWLISVSKHLQLYHKRIVLDQMVLDNYGFKALQNADVDRHLVPEIIARLQRAVPEAAAEIITDSDYVKRVLHLFERTDQKFCYLEQITDSDFKYYFLRPVKAEKLLSEYDVSLTSSILKDVIGSNIWDMTYFRQLSSAHSIRYAEVFRIIRLALIDSPHGPPVMELLHFFGRKECLIRFLAMHEMLEASKLSSAV
ncbi:unnamed protein product [Thelazia callipaeda]|uniref:tRNA-synt_1c domain-containing protein n=1 Tax=Thelazia callipaeda TaxID=103827 RepID=A0A0N5CW63_THECL|nr:unnamed protein product [Thelazia callipaeda]